jgi:hypothetical protein
VAQHFVQRYPAGALGPVPHAGLDQDDSVTCGCRAREVGRGRDPNGKPSLTDEHPHHRNEALRISGVVGQNRSFTGFDSQARPGCCSGVRELSKRIVVYRKALAGAVGERRRADRFYDADLAQ